MGTRKRSHGRTGRTLVREPPPIAETEIDRLRASLRGTPLLPGEPGYDAARSIWNVMIDRHPAVIIRAAGAADVIQAVTLARDHRLDLAVRGGGHNIAGNAVCDREVMRDLSLMRSVQIDPDARRAGVEGCALLSDVDKEALAFGQIVPVGINSTTGIAGLTLGGGFGWTSRRFGLAIDISARRRHRHRRRQASPRRCDEERRSVRGGGSNFGAVTAFEFGLNPLGPEVIAGLLLHPLERARALGR